MQRSQEQERPEESSQHVLGQRRRDDHAQLDADDAADADEGGRPEVDVAVAAGLAPRPDGRRRQDREQRRRLRVELREPDPERSRHPISNLPATTASSAANAYARPRTGMRCWRDVPATTPTTAGTPTSAAARGSTFPWNA